MNNLRNISRRGFIKGIGLASGGLVLASSAGIMTSCEPKEVFEFNPNLFVQLNSDGELILLATRSEMGQGIRTALTSVIADEMEADWDRVTVKQGPGDDKYGDQNTDGSKSVRIMYKTMREMGATTKSMLLSAAAIYWTVPKSECRAENHFVIHKSGKKRAFGELVEIAKTLDVPKEISFKSSKDFKYIGKTLPGKDVDLFADGSAVFGLDIRIPDMSFAAIKRCPVTFGKVISFDASEALKINGVLDVVEVPLMDFAFGALGGIAIIATNTWAAFKGRDALKVTWDLGENESYNSEAFLEEITKNAIKKGKVEKSIGNVEKAFSEGSKSIERIYQLPHLVHAPMEVPNAAASVKANSCEVWAPTQTPQRCRTLVAKLLELDEQDVKVNVTFLGGGFGRKAKPDYVIEAAFLSKTTNKPIQVVWSREDDIRHSYYHTVSAQYMKGSLDQNGKVTGWLHRFAFPTIGSTFKKGSNMPAKWEANSASKVPFDIPNMQIEAAKADAHVRIGWLRSVINIPHGFAINVFADELAHEAGIDPLQFNLDLIGKDRIEKTKNAFKYDTAKLKHVLKKAAENAQWGRSLEPGHALGLAVHYSFLSYVACVAEVSVVDDLVKVHKVFMVIDCGTPINRDTIVAQMQGSVIFGMSLAFYGRITAKNGAVEQSNFDDYPLIRMSEVPEIEVEIIASESNPTGVGEPGVPVVAPAILNAVFKASGKRYRSLPLDQLNLI